MNTCVAHLPVRLNYWLAAAAAACSVGWSWPAYGAVELVPAGILTVGVEYAPPAFVGGAKVRTPEGIDALLVDDIGRRLSAKAQMTLFSPANPTQSLQDGKARVVLTPVTETQAASASSRVIATGYSTGAMAIMRSDTDIKQWKQLQGRTVCLAEGGRYVGTLAEKYGAIEMVFKAPADSLLALRIGECDAAVHDSSMLNELIKLPEWKKFSARLPVQDLKPLAFVVASNDAELAEYLKQAAKAWANSHHLEKVTKAAVRDIAFEVYLDQTVTDCH